MQLILCLLVANLTTSKNVFHLKPLVSLLYNIGSIQHAMSESLKLEA